MCKCSCCGACVININHPMHACVRETYLFSTNFIGIGGANWSHLRLCCIFCDIPQFTSSQLDPIVLKSQLAEGGGLVGSEEGSDSPGNSPSSSHGREEPTAARTSNTLTLKQSYERNFTHVHSEK